MGEVYRARDATLRRDVALKILPELAAFDPDRLARCRREAQLLASLNRPNIAAIYGFEESTSVHALVLELVERPTLADRIAHGSLPVDEALPIAKEIAAALQPAHEQGIIHRDLKPASMRARRPRIIEQFSLPNYPASVRANPIHPAVPPAVVRMICETTRNSPPHTVAGCGRRLEMRS